MFETRSKSQVLVDGACKPKRASPKSKYLQPLTLELQQFEKIPAVCSGLQLKLCHSNPTVVLKALITIHHAVNHGEHNRVLQAVSKYLKLTAVTNRPAISRILVRYAKYMELRIYSFSKNGGHDVIKAKADMISSERLSNAGEAGRMLQLRLGDGSLAEVEQMIQLVDALTDCLKGFDEEDSDDLVQTALFLLLGDMFHLAAGVCESVINILSSFTKYKLHDGQLALKLYISAVSQIEAVRAILDDERRKGHAYCINDLKMPPPQMEGTLRSHLQFLESDSLRRSASSRKPIPKLREGILLDDVASAQETVVFSPVPSGTRTS